MSAKPSTFSDLIEALREHAKPKDAEGLTVREISERLGCSRNLVQERILSLIERGQVTVGRRIQKRIDGMTCHVPVYMFRAGKGAK